MPCPLKRVLQITPIAVDRLQFEIRNYPHPDKATYIIQGLHHGFHLGFNHNISLKSAAGNMASALANPQVIDNCLHTEVQLGRVAAPFFNLFFTVSMSVALVLSPNALSRENNALSWTCLAQLVIATSMELLVRINSLQYMKVDDIIAGIMQLGRGTLMAKFDVQNAYCIVPVHPEDHLLLGMKWQGAYYVDMVLPFGSRSAPFILTSIADLVEWIAKQNYDVSFQMDYLDDFHTLGPPRSSTCQHNLDNSIYCFSKLAIPLHLDKFKGPSTC